jgi:hypothetical protein
MAWQIPFEALQQLEDILKLNTENLKAHLLLNGKIGVSQRTNAGEIVPLT